jgi:hypothetical protein
MSLEVETGAAALDGTAVTFDMSLFSFFFFFGDDSALAVVDLFDFIDFAGDFNGDDFNDLFEFDDDDDVDCGGLR